MKRLLPHVIALLVLALVLYACLYPSLSGQGPIGRRGSGGTTQGYGSRLPR